MYRFWPLHQCQFLHTWHLTKPQPITIGSHTRNWFSTASQLAFERKRHTPRLGNQGTKWLVTTLLKLKTYVSERGQPTGKKDTHWKRSPVAYFMISNNTKMLLTPLWHIIHIIGSEALFIITFSVEIFRVIPSLSICRELKLSSQRVKAARLIRFLPLTISS